MTVLDADTPRKDAKSTKRSIRPSTRRERT
jgi:hypothetical protein